MQVSQLTTPFCSPLEDPMVCCYIVYLIHYELISIFFILAYGYQI